MLSSKNRIFCITAALNHSAKMSTPRPPSCTSRNNLSTWCGVSTNAKRLSQICALGNEVFVHKIIRDYAHVRNRSPLPQQIPPRNLQWSVLAKQTETYAGPASGWNDLITNMSNLCVRLTSPARRSEPRQNTSNPSTALPQNIPTDADMCSRQNSTTCDLKSLNLLNTVPSASPRTGGEN